MLQPSSVTPSGIITMRGVYDFVATHGVPLEIVMDIMKSKNRMPDWLDYVECGLAQGANPKGLLAKLSTAVLDVYGSEFHDEWYRLLQRILSHKESAKRM